MGVCPVVRNSTDCSFGKPAAKAGGSVTAGDGRSDVGWEGVQPELEQQALQTALVYGGRLWLHCGHCPLNRREGARNGRVSLEDSSKGRREFGLIQSFRPCLQLLDLM